MEHVFAPNSGEDQKKKGLLQKWNTFFPRIQVETHTQMHAEVKFLEGMQMKTILKLLGGVYPPIPPGFGALGCFNYGTLLLLRFYII